MSCNVLRCHQLKKWLNQFSLKRDINKRISLIHAPHITIVYCLCVFCIHIFQSSHVHRSMVLSKSTFSNWACSWSTPTKRFTTPRRTSLPFALCSVLYLRPRPHPPSVHGHRVLHQISYELTMTTTSDPAGAGSIWTPPRLPSTRTVSVEIIAVEMHNILLIYIHYARVCWVSYFRYRINAIRGKITSLFHSYCSSVFLQVQPTSIRALTVVKGS